MLTWVWKGNYGFYLPTRAPLLNLLFFSSIEASPSLLYTVPANFTQEECQELMTLIQCFCVSTIHQFFFSNILICMRRQMTMMTKASKLFKFLGFSSGLVSQIYSKKALCAQFKCSSLLASNSLRQQTFPY